jgi:two-component system, chemotaxis family, protein-glutamate methylesterase/glutaminase
MTATALARTTPVRHAEPRRVVLIDDSVVARAMLSRIFESDPDFTVAAVFDRAARALDWLQHNRCDLILLDIEMPGRSGLAALPDLIEASGRAQIVVVSSIAEEGAVATLNALALGAADAIAKPAAGQIGRQFGIELIERLRGLAEDGPVDVARSPALPMRDASARRAACVAIGASTGGIHALAQLLRALPAHFTAPILVTQHLPLPFMAFFADQLASIAGRPCHVAKTGEFLANGTILIAPGDGHLCVEQAGTGARVEILRHRAQSRCLPSVDPMFDSVGRCFGDSAFGVVLSGMGRDGAEGAVSLAKRGGTLLVQDSESATIWGMPGSIARAGLASLIAPPDRIASFLASRGSVR